MCLGVVSIGGDGRPSAISKRRSYAHLVNLCGSLSVITDMLLNCNFGIFHLLYVVNYVARLYFTIDDQNIS